MSERWISAVKLLALLLLCLVLWQTSNLFGTEQVGERLGEDISALQLLITKAQSPAKEDSDAQPEPLPQSVLDLADSAAFGKKPKPKPPSAPPDPTLIGIAGASAFIKMPSGTVVPLELDGETDGIRLVKIGLNRVLIEQDGKTHELTIFSGLGSDSLLDDSSTEAEEKNQ